MMPSLNDSIAAGGSAEAKALAGRFAALSHPARIEILRQLSGTRSCCCKEIVEQFDLAQSTVSQHLKILVEAGLVRLSSDKQRSRYEIDREAMAGMSSAVAGLVESCCTRS